MSSRTLVIATVLSSTLWYAGIALATTGHTKLLWGAHKVITGGLTASSHARGVLHSLEGDTGAYVNGN